jgi:hypothetical protein
MAQRYWVGGSGTWDTTNTTNWSATSGGAGGASVPTTADNAIINSSSGAGTVTLGENVPCVQLDIRTYIGTLNFNNFEINVAGNSIVVLRADTGSTITGNPVVNLTYSGGAGTRTIGVGAMSETNSLSVNITAGSDIIAPGNSNFKNFNTTGFSGTLNNTTRTFFGDVVIGTTTTMGAGSTAINTFGKTSGTQTVTTNGKTFDFPLTFNGVGSTFAFQDALTQGSTRAFTITNGTVQLKSGVTSTVGSFVANNANTKSLQSTTPGSQATISQASGTVTVADLTIRDSNAVGGASWTAYADYENIDAGNNDGWNFSLSPPYASYEPPIIIRSFTQPRRF